MVTRTLRGFRRLPAASQSRNSRICTVSRASARGIPVALPMAVAAAIQEGAKTSGSIGERIQLPNLECGRWPKIVVLFL